MEYMKAAPTGRPSQGQPLDWVKVTNLPRIARRPGLCSPPGLGYRDVKPSQHPHAQEIGRCWPILAWSSAGLGFRPDRLPACLWARRPILPPEQARGVTIDNRSDMYALVWLS